jgi:putative MATE family efflux protein
VDDHRLKDAPFPVVPASEPDEPPPMAVPVNKLLDSRRPTWLLVLSLAWPVLLQQLLAFAVSLFDGLVAGRFQEVSGAEQIASQAAQTTANYIAWFLTSFTILVSVGATALVARLYGAGDRRAASHAANQSVLLGLVLGLVGGAVGYAAVPYFLDLLQLQGESAKLAADYLRPLFALLVFQVVESAGIASLVGAGDTLTGMLTRGGVAIVNMPLTWFCFHGAGPLPGLGFAGIGLGTALANALGGLAVLALLARGRAGLQLDPRLLWPNGDLIRRLLRISVPAALDSLSLTIGHLCFLGIVNHTLGDADQAAHGIAIRWESLSFLTGQAFGTAAMALVGQNLGAGRPDRAARSGWTALALGGSWMALMGVVFYVLAPEMFGLFCPKPEQAPIVAAGVPVLRLVALAQPALAVTNIFTACLRGAGETRVPVLITAFGIFVVRLTLASVLTPAQIDLRWLGLGVYPAFNLGLVGAWTAMFIDLYVRGLFFLVLFAGGWWKRVRV